MGGIEARLIFSPQLSPLFEEAKLQARQPKTLERIESSVTRVTFVSPGLPYIGVMDFVERS